MRWGATVLATIAAAGVIGAACSFTDGAPWGTVSGALEWNQSLEELVGSDRVTLDSASAPVEIKFIEVNTSSGGSGQAGEFDPQNPPPGYSLCHNGHCHADSGELVPYADIRAEIAGGASGGSSESVVATRGATLRFEASDNAQSVRVGPIDIARETTISKVAVEATNVSMDGQIAPADGSDDGNPVPLEVNLGSLELGGLTSADLTVGPDAPESQTLRLCATWDEGWFQKVDLDGLEVRDGRVLISRIVNTDAGDALREALANVTWTQGGCAN